MTALVVIHLALAPLYVTHPQIVREGQPPTDVVDPGANVGSAPVPSRTLASWTTLDTSDVECSTCGGAECPECGRSTPDSYDDEIYHGCKFCGDKPCPDCTNGRRPLRAGDRVQIVAGELPPGWMEFPDRSGIVCLTNPHRVIDVDLPAPGTVVGRAMVEWVGPILTDDDWPMTDGHVTVDSEGTVWRWPAAERITGHDHVDWSPATDCTHCRDGCDVYECCVTGGGGRVVSWDHLCDRHRDHQGFHDCRPGCCEVCAGLGTIPRFAVKLREAVAM